MVFFKLPTAKCKHHYKESHTVQDHLITLSNHKGGSDGSICDITDYSFLIASLSSWFGLHSAILHCFKSAISLIIVIRFVSSPK